MATREIPGQPDIEEFQDKGRTYCGYEDREFERLAIGRYQFSLKFIKEGDVCLDAASGSGYGSALICQKAKEVIGLELDDHALKYAREHYQRDKISFRKADLTQPFGFAISLPARLLSLPIVLSFLSLRTKCRPVSSNYRATAGFVRFRHTQSAVGCHRYWCY